MIIIIEIIPRSFTQVATFHHFSLRKGADYQITFISINKYSDADNTFFKILLNHNY